MNERTKRIFLKPCPICGSAPELCSRECGPWGDGIYCTDYYYKCTGCKYVASYGILDTGKCNDGLIVEDTSKLQWNTMVDDIIDMIKERYC